MTTTPLVFDYHDADVIIAGGGVSGIFCAWRLLRDNPAAHIVVLERTERFGGRLFTVLPEIDGHTVKDEMGGMRFNDEMPYINKLIGELGLDDTKVPFPMGATSNRYFFRGSSFTWAEDKGSGDYPILATLFPGLSSTEKNQDPNAIFGTVMQRINKANNTSSDYIPVGATEWQTYRNTFRWKNTILNEWGLWALMRDMDFTQEFIEMFSRRCGFMGPLQSYINAGAGLQIIFDFPEGATFHTLRNGMSSIVDEMISFIENCPNAQLIANASVECVNFGDASPLEVVTTEGGWSKGYRCNRVILALPKVPLKTLYRKSPVMQSNAQLWSDLGAVQSMELSKIGLFYSRRWWNTDFDLNIMDGPNFSDLPAGSIYTFDPIDGPDAKYTGPSAITVYTDFERGNLWKEAQNSGMAYSSTIPQPPHTEPASTQLVEEVHRDLGLLFGIDAAKIPQPVLTVYHVWGDEVAGYPYAYHQWKMNFDDRAVMSRLWNPSANVYLCGEAFSAEQGWVEGALMTADTVLTNAFGLAPWINPQTLQNSVTTTQPVSKPAKVHTLIPPSQAVKGFPTIVPMAGSKTSSKSKAG